MPVERPNLHTIGATEKIVHGLRTKLHSLNRDTDRGGTRPITDQDVSTALSFIGSLMHRSFPNLARAFQLVLADESVQRPFFRNRGERTAARVTIEDLAITLAANEDLLNERAGIQEPDLLRGEDTTVGDIIFTYYDLHLSPVPNDAEQAESRAGRLVGVEGFVFSPMMEETLSRKKNNP